MVPKPVRKVILARYQPGGPSHTSEYRVSQWRSSQKRGFRPVCPQALLKALDEDELGPEERVRRCQADARQFLQVKPDIDQCRSQIESSYSQPSRKFRF